MFILGALGPLHYSRSDGLTIRIDQLPVTRELRRRHPFEQWFGRVLSTSPSASTNEMTSLAAQSRTSVIFAFRSKSSSSMVGID